MRPRPYKPIHKVITTVPTGDLQALQSSNTALRKALVEKQNELYAREGGAHQHRQLLAGALSILLWGPVRILVKLLEPLIQRSLGLPKDFARKAADVLHFEERRRVAARTGSEEGGSEDGVDEGREETPSAEEEGRER